MRTTVAVHTSVEINGMPSSAHPALPGIKSGHLNGQGRILRHV